jgi:type II pantothenate kinase
MAGIRAAAVTGGRSAFFEEKIFGLRPHQVDEIRAIGLGASFVSGERRCLAVSMGTGTCIVLFEKGKSRHIIGSGLGGGTIIGLSGRLIGETRAKNLACLAEKGVLSRADLSVNDVVGRGIGIVSGDSTAANFAKPGKCRGADIAAAVQNMVAESVAVLAISAARQCACEKIVFVGRGPKFPLVKKRLLAAARLFGERFLFPKNLEFATAIGAGLACANNNFK